MTSYESRYLRQYLRDISAVLKEIEGGSMPLIDPQTLKIWQVAIKHIDEHLILCDSSAISKAISASGRIENEKI